MKGQKVSLALSAISLVSMLVYRNFIVSNEAFQAENAFIVIWYPFEIALKASELIWYSFHALKSIHGPEFSDIQRALSRASQKSIVD